MRTAAPRDGKLTIHAISYTAAPRSLLTPLEREAQFPAPNPARPNYTLFPPPRPQAFRVGFGALTGNSQSHGIPPLLATYHGSIEGASRCTNGHLSETACSKSM